MNVTESTVNMLNKLIRQSVIYGADSGGSYCQNKEQLEAILNECLQYFNLTGYEITWNGDWQNPIIVPCKDK